MEMYSKNNKTKSSVAEKIIRKVKIEKNIYKYMTAY